MLKAELEKLSNQYAIIGQDRGIGLLLALELVMNPETKEPFPASENAGELLTDLAFKEGLVIYPRKTLNGLEGDHVLVSPPLVINEADIKELVKRLDRSLKEAARRLTGK